MRDLITDEIVEAAARYWWQHSKAENDKFFGPLGVDPDPGWDGISEADREHVREDITRPQLEAAAPLIAALALEAHADLIVGIGEEERIHHKRRLREHAARLREGTGA